MRHQTEVIWTKPSSRGQTMAEYAMILATVALVAAALIQNAGTIETELVQTVCNLFHVG
jgi:Flp pilus assembly pilin Flp